jgi:hypothetical protein
MMLALADSLTGFNLHQWYDHLADLGEEHGYFDRLGPRHAALFIDSGPRLLVTFETVAQIRATHTGHLPFGLNVVRQTGWSHVAVLADEETWFRSRVVYGYLDRLTDDGFFEDFDQVLFAGAGAGGYAAAAFSVASPGARVLAMRPQATLDPALTGWDPRFARHRRLDFTSRYGFAPDMLDAASHAVVLHDPFDRFDAMHAAMFHRSNVTSLRCPHAGPAIERRFAAMGMLTPLVQAAMEGTLDRVSFARLWRARRHRPDHLAAVLAALERRDRPRLAAQLCGYALRNADSPLFAASPAEVDAMDTADSLPPLRLTPAMATHRLDTGGDHGRAGVSITAAE